MKCLFSVLIKKIGLAGAALGLFTMFAPTLALADELNSGDNAWILTSTALVLFMTLTGLALFYSGLVRDKKCSIGIDAMFFDCLFDVHFMDGVRLWFSFW